MTKALVSAPVTILKKTCNLSLFNNCKKSDIYSPCNPRQISQSFKIKLVIPISRSSIISVTKLSKIAQHLFVTSFNVIIVGIHNKGKKKEITSNPSLTLNIKKDDVTMTKLADHVFAETKVDTIL